MSRPLREHPRYAHQAALTLHARGAACHGRTLNVSRGGLCAVLAGPADPADVVRPGLEVGLDLQLVFEGEGWSEALRLPARVVWCTAVDEAHQVGLAFLPLDRARAEDLALFLRFLERGAAAECPPPPRSAACSIDERFR